MTCKGKGARKFAPVTVLTNVSCAIPQRCNIARHGAAILACTVFIESVGRNERLF